MSCRLAPTEATASTPGEAFGVADGAILDAANRVMGQPCDVLSGALPLPEPISRASRARSVRTSVEVCQPATRRLANITSAVATGGSSVSGTRSSNAFGEVNQAASVSPAVPASGFAGQFLDTRAQ